MSFVGKKSKLKCVVHRIGRNNKREKITEKKVTSRFAYNSYNNAVSKNAANF